MNNSTVDCEFVYINKEKILHNVSSTVMVFCKLLKLYKILFLCDLSLLQKSTRVTRALMYMEKCLTIYHFL